MTIYESYRKALIEACNLDVGLAAEVVTTLARQRDELARAAVYPVERRAAQIRDEVEETFAEPLTR